MKLTFQTDLLKSAVTYVGAAVSSRSSLPILSCIKLEIVEGKTLLTATNLDCTLTAEIVGAVEGKPRTIVIPQRRLAKALSLSDSEQITLDATKKGQLVITAGLTEATLKLLDSDDFPPSPWVDMDDPIQADGDWARALLRVQPALSQDESRYTLTGVEILSESGSIRFAATDGRRLHVARVEKAGNHKFDCLLPGDIVPIAVHLFERDCAVLVELHKDTIQIESGGLCLVAKLIEGTYPNIKQVLPKDAKPWIRLDNVPAILEALGAEGIIAEGDKHQVVLTPNKEGVLLSGSTEAGSFRSAVPGSSLKSTHSAAFNTEYLRDGLKAMGAPSVELRMNADTEAMTFEVPNGQVVLMPMRTA